MFYKPIIKYILHNRANFNIILMVSDSLKNFSVAKANLELEMSISFSIHPFIISIINWPWLSIDFCHQSSLVINYQSTLVIIHLQSEWPKCGMILWMKTLITLINDMIVKFKLMFMKSTGKLWIIHFWKLFVMVKIDQVVTFW